MDTSKEYVTMCEKAKEIQKQKPCGYDKCSVYYRTEEEPYCPKGCYVEKYGTRVYCSECRKKSRYTTIHEKCGNDSEGAIWLPTQDQLQSLIDFQKYEKAACGWTAAAVRLIWLFDWIDNKLRYRHHLWKYHQYSMEQFWFMFVMEEKHHKIWDGKKWRRTKR